jgi:Holliday junction resolvase-like predicted endonuclease
MNPKHKGAYAEAVAKAYLLRMGFEVFENVSQHGSVDFIAMTGTGTDIGYFDVKSASLRRSKVGDKTTLRFQSSILGGLGAR